MSLQSRVGGLAVLLACAFVARAESNAVVPAPHVRTVEQVDDFFGTKVADPYRWMEDDSSPELRAFIDAQNARTHAFVDTPQRELIKQRMTELYDYPRQSAPRREGKFAFYTINTGLQNQSVTYVTESIGQPGRVLIDPNKLSEDGTAFLAGTDYTEDGSLLAFGVAQSGSDHSEIRVMEVATGKILPDTLPSARQGVSAWKRDNSGFHYGKYPKTTEHGKAEQAFNYKLYFHKLGTPAEQDVLVYERPEDKEMSFGLGITDDGKYETLYLNRGTKRQNRLYWRIANSDSAWNKLIDNEDFDYRVVGNDDSVLFVWTNNDAPRGRLISIDLNNSDKANWKELIPQSTDVLGGVSLIGGKFVVTYMHDAQEVLKLYGKDGKFERDVPLPTVGAISGVSGKPEHNDFYYTFTSYTYPSTIYHYDLKTNEQSVYFAPKVKFTPSEYETKQLFATSKDGTKVPVFVTFKKGLPLDGNNPCILGGYGGFNASTTPGFSSSRVAWLEKGGVYAQACMRGGGEYGESWHQAGMLDRKQNVFDDFYSAAQLLANEKFTSPAKLAIQGGSNGGLLVAACMLQHPEAYGAVICQVPVADMLRYHVLGIGRFWTVEYGAADASPEQFKTLYAYSPLHNVKAGQSYPPIMITTGEGDNRVVPAHSYKFAATLQAQASGSNPILLRVESKAGHGGGKPTSKILDEGADIYAFLMKTFKID